MTATPRETAIEDRLVRALSDAGVTHAYNEAGDENMDCQELCRLILVPAVQKILTDAMTWELE